MMRRTTLRAFGALGAMLAVVAGCAIATPAARAAGVQGTNTPAVTGVDGSWGTMQAVPGWAGLKTPNGGSTREVSCASAGNCLLGGGYEDAGKRNQAFVASEVNGTWGKAEELPGFAALNKYAKAGYAGDVTTVSCPSAGNCAVAGYFNSSGVNHGFVADMAGGRWRPAQEIPYLATLDVRHNVFIQKVSCVSAGNCAVVGGYADSTGLEQPFVALEYAGHWQDADSLLVSSFNQGNAWATSVSCPAVHHCVLGGRTTDASGNTQSWIAYQYGANGWGEFEPNGATSSGTGFIQGVTSVSCSSAGNCAIVGDYVSGGTLIPYVINVYGGTWDASAMNISVPGGTSAVVSSVSCRSQTECAATGFYISASVDVPFTVDEIRQSWGTAQPLSGYANGAYPYQVSCAAPGDCAVAGEYTDGSGEHPFVADETGYTWYPMQPVSSAWGITESVSCADPGNCAAVGYYEHGTLDLPFIVERKWADPTTTTVALGAGSAVYGHEQAVHAIVTVQPAAYVLPGGTATVKAGSTTLCTVKLTVLSSLGDGTGNCAIPATRLPAGKAKVTASYNGAPGYARSTSGYKVLTVTRAATKTRLTLSAATVKYGHENAERLSVAMSPQYAGVPSGTVRISSGKTLICAITLKSGKGSCVLKPAQLKAGGYAPVASYSGNADFTASASPKEALTITR